MVGSVEVSRLGDEEALSDGSEVRGGGGGGASSAIASSNLSVCSFSLSWSSIFCFTVISQFCQSSWGITSESLPRSTSKLQIEDSNWLLPSNFIEPFATRSRSFFTSYSVFFKFGSVGPVTPFHHIRPRRIAVRGTSHDFGQLLSQSPSLQMTVYSVIDGPQARRYPDSELSASWTMFVEADRAAKKTFPVLVNVVADVVTVVSSSCPSSCRTVGVGGLKSRDDFGGLKRPPWRRTWSFRVSMVEGDPRCIGGFESTRTLSSFGETCVPSSSADGPRRLMSLAREVATSSVEQSS